MIAKGQMCSAKHCDSSTSYIPEHSYYIGFVWFKIHVSMFCSPVFVGKIHTTTNRMMQQFLDSAMQVGEEIKKFMECVHGKVAVINKTIGFLEAPYNPAPNARHGEYLAANAAYGVKCVLIYIYTFKYNYTYVYIYIIPPCRCLKKILTLIQANCLPFHLFLQHDPGLVIKDGEGPGIHDKEVGVRVWELGQASRGTFNGGRCF